MTIQSLGVGSGLALDDLVTQLLEAERKPKQDRLDRREETIEAEISGLGQLKSKLSDFKDSVDDLRKDEAINGREPKITNPNEDISTIEAEASSSALKGDYQITVKQLASGSRIETANAVDGGFASSTDSVLSSGSGSLTFKVGNTGDSFSIDVTAGMTLAQLREKINSSENNFGVNANIISTGTADGGAKLVFTSDVAGAGNDLQIVNDNNLADLNRVATTDSAETASYLSPVVNAQNAIAVVDGIAVESASNEFENTIQNVSFTANEVSPFTTTAVSAEFPEGRIYESSRLKIGFDKEGLEEKINKFIENYNGIIDEISKLTRYGESDLEEDGALAGDSMVRSIQSGLASLVGSGVSSSELGGLFSIGIEIDSDGKLEIGNTDFGLGSGKDRLSDALDDAFDEVAKLFSSDNDGIATRMYDFIEQYTSFSGILSTRERAAKDNKDTVFDDRERFELQMLNYEQVLRDKYLNLDQTVSRLNRTGNALLASLR
ncbi:flagellar filament capping protein FliD [Alteromonas oceanisediminis]|uniref:flagellar filament capping protein FliD n=1 Tax=Alteromonas oceanisediminis TaxID=2836180 RepID=UPI001BDB1788|nr:flagellar filament capping protein FliD [Alteromonas oceanisediminis]MBT0584958.1 flagellar filament capping protein FliD [Alteromonas oceanisediminis]